MDSTLFFGEKGSGSPSSPTYDDVYGDYDGRKSIRILNPCTQADLSSQACQWFDNPAVLSMQGMRWYAAAEVLADGIIVLIGGFTSGVYRNLPKTDPAYEGGGATPTYEFYPSRGPATVMNFMISTFWSQLVRSHVPHAVREASRPGEPLHK